VRRLGFRDDRKDFDRVSRDVIENSNLPNPKPTLRPAEPAQSLYPALARPGWLAPQVPFDRIPQLGAPVSGQGPV
jgi:hypothetical protein